MRKNAVIFMLMFMTFVSSPFEQKDSNMTIVDAFNKSGIEIKEYNINGWVKLKELYYNEEDLKALADSVLSSLGYITQETKTYPDGKNKKIIKTASSEEENVSITVQSNYISSLKKYECAIIIDITQYGNIRNIINTGDKVTKNLEKYGVGPPVNICITGYQNGKIDGYLRNETIKGIIDDLGAVVIERINNDNLISVSGYTKNINNYIKSNNKKININVASRYSPADNKTFFWIGTPVINMEY